jgi:hypothetical protein
MIYTKIYHAKNTITMNKIIIHISGASGSGKTTLGNKIKDKFKNKIVVKDLDELLDEYLLDTFGKKRYTYNDIDEKLYQKYIDNFIGKQKKPIIFVGLNDNFVDFYPSRKNIYYELYANNKFYINISDEIIIKQKCVRFLDNLKNDKLLMKKLIDDNKEFIKLVQNAMVTECDTTFIKKWTAKWKRDYKKQNYKFMTRENIFKEVVKILQNI